ncbi:MAG: hypothetical protein HYZ94_02040 [Candidatus Omnitrophica bacterium]|nr:hypothetical protein [Candidatus Omnitrophota bacterium]
MLILSLVIGQSPPAFALRGVQLRQQKSGLEEVERQLGESGDAPSPVVRDLRSGRTPAEGFLDRFLGDPFPPAEQVKRALEGRSVSTERRQEAAMAIAVQGRPARDAEERLRNRAEAVARLSSIFPRALSRAAGSVTVPVMGLAAGGAAASEATPQMSRRKMVQTTAGGLIGMVLLGEEAVAGVPDLGMELQFRMNEGVLNSYITRNLFSMLSAAKCPAFTFLGDAHIGGQVLHSEKANIMEAKLIVMPRDGPLLIRVGGKHWVVPAGRKAILHMDARHPEVRNQVLEVGGDAVQGYVLEGEKALGDYLKELGSAEGKISGVEGLGIGGRVAIAGEQRNGETKFIVVPLDDRMTLIVNGRREMLAKGAPLHLKISKAQSVCTIVPGQAYAKKEEAPEAPPSAPETADNGIVARIREKQEEMMTLQAERLEGAVTRARVWLNWIENLYARGYSTNTTTLRSIGGSGTGSSPGQTERLVHTPPMQRLAVEREPNWTVPNRGPFEGDPLFKRPIRRDPPFPFPDSPRPALAPRAVDVPTAEEQQAASEVTQEQPNIQYSINIDAREGTPLEAAQRGLRLAQLEHGQQKIWEQIKRYANSDGQDRERLHRQLGKAIGEQLEAEAEFWEEERMILRNWQTASRNVLRAFEGSRPGSSSVAEMVRGAYTGQARIYLEHYEDVETGYLALLSQVRALQGIYQDLVRLGAPLPAIPSKDSTPSESTPDTPLGVPTPMTGAPSLPTEERARITASVEAGIRTMQKGMITRIGTGRNMRERWLQWAREVAPRGYWVRLEDTIAVEEAQQQSQKRAQAVLGAQTALMGVTGPQIVAVQQQLHEAILRQHEAAETTLQAMIKRAERNIGPARRLAELTGNPWYLRSDQEALRKAKAELKKAQYVTQIARARDALGLPLLAPTYGDLRLTPGTRMIDGTLLALAPNYLIGLAEKPAPEQTARQLSIIHRATVGMAVEEMRDLRDQASAQTEWSRAMRGYQDTLYQRGFAVHSDAHPGETQMRDAVAQADQYRYRADRLAQELDIYSGVHPETAVAQRDAVLVQEARRELVRINSELNAAQENVRQEGNLAALGFSDSRSVSSAQSVVDDLTAKKREVELQLAKHALFGQKGMPIVPTQTAAIPSASLERLRAETEEPPQVKAVLAGYVRNTQGQMSPYTTPGTRWVYLVDPIPAPGTNYSLLHGGIVQMEYVQVPPLNSNGEPNPLAGRWIPEDQTLTFDADLGSIPEMRPRAEEAMGRIEVLRPPGPLPPGKLPTGWYALVGGYKVATGKPTPLGLLDSDPNYGVVAYQAFRYSSLPMTQGPGKRQEMPVGFALRYVNKDLFLKLIRQGIPLDPPGPEEVLEIRHGGLRTYGPLGYSLYGRIKDAGELLPPVTVLGQAYQPGTVHEARVVFRERGTEGVWANELYQLSKEEIQSRQRQGGMASSRSGLEEAAGITRRRFLLQGVQGYAATVAAWAALTPAEFLAQQPARKPRGLLASLAERLGPNRDLGLVVWDPTDILKLSPRPGKLGFFEKAVQAGVTVVWISGFRFLQLSQEEQKALLHQANAAGLPKLGFVDGNYDWAQNRTFVGNFYGQLTAALLAHERGGSLGRVGVSFRVAFAADVEPYTRPAETGWNGDLSAYSDLIQTVVLPRIRSFASRVPQRVSDTPLITFEPFWYRENALTDKNERIRGLRNMPQGTAVAGMLYRNSPEQILEVSRQLRGRVAEMKGVKWLITVETVSPETAGGPQLTFHRQEKQIPPVLLKVLDGLTKPELEQLGGVIIHSSGPLAADALLDQWLEAAPGRTQAAPRPVPAGPVRVVEGSLRRTATELSIRVTGALQDAEAVGLLRTDNFYAQPRAGASVPIAPDGIIRLSTVYQPKGRPGWLEAQESVILVFRKADVPLFYRKYNEEIGLRGILTADRMDPKPLLIIRVSKGGQIRAGLEEVRLSRREFFEKVGVGAGAVGAMAAGLAPYSELLAQAAQDPARAELVARIRRMVDPADYQAAVRFIDSQRIVAPTRVVPQNIPQSALKRYQAVRKKPFTGFNFKGLYRSYRRDSRHPRWTEELFRFAEYGRVWIYDSALGLKADLAAAQVDLASGRRTEATSRLEKAAAAASTLVELGKDEEGLGFAGGWRFSYNTQGDSWVDPRAPMGAVLWAINALYDYIGFVLTLKEPGAAPYRAQALDHLVWVNRLVGRLVFGMQVTKPDDPCYGLIRSMTSNTLLDAGLSLDEAGYRAYQGEMNKFSRYFILEHTADALDTLRKAGEVTDRAAQIDARRFGTAEAKKFRAELPGRHELLLTSAWEKGRLGDRSVTALEPDGTQNTSEAIDLYTWLARMYLSYDEERVRQAAEHVWSEFRTKGKDGAIATRLKDLILDDVPAAGLAVVRRYAEEEIAGIHFFGLDFKDPFVDVPADQRSRLVQMIQREATEGYRDLLIAIALTTKDPARREEALHRAELVSKTVHIVQEIYGFGYATRHVTSYFNSLEAMAAAGSAAIVSARMQGASITLVEAPPPGDFTFQGRKPGAAAPPQPVRPPSVPAPKPTPKPAVTPAPAPAAPAELGATVQDLKAGSMTLQFQVPKNLQGKPLVAAAFIKTDIWYIQPSDQRDAMKTITKKDQLYQAALTTAAGRSPFIGGQTVGRAVAVFESPQKFDQFLAAYRKSGYRAVNEHALRIFLIDEKKNVVSTDRLASLHPAVVSPLHNLSSFHGAGLDVGPGSEAFANAQRPLDPEILAQARGIIEQLTRKWGLEREGTRVAAVSPEVFQTDPALAALVGEHIREYILGSAHLLILPAEKDWDPTQAAGWVVSYIGLGAGLEEYGSDTEPVLAAFHRMAVEDAGLTYLGRHSLKGRAFVAVMQRIIANLAGLEEGAIDQEDVMKLVQALVTLA